MEGDDKDEQTASGEADEAVYAEGIDGALRKSTEKGHMMRIFRLSNKDIECYSAVHVSNHLMDYLKTIV